MKKQFICQTVALTIFLSVIGNPLSAQKIASSSRKSVKPIIFAVLNDGLSLEPVAYIDKGKLEEMVTGSDEPAAILTFDKAYYKKGTAYTLIFGGAAAGTSSVKSSNPNAECSKNVATAVTKTSKTPLKGNVMALATNAPSKSTAGFRRKPTAAEKIEADSIAKAEFAKQKLTPKVLRFHNLTAVDLDNDGTAEIVGSYWVDIDKTTRGLLFLIAGKGNSGKYTVGYEEYRRVDQGNIMGGGSIKDVDGGIYNELLLDFYDIDGDGTGEIFTYVPGYEGAGFNVYRRNGSKWTRTFEGSNYHCAF